MTNRCKFDVTVAAVVEDRGRFLVVEEHTRHGLRLNNPAGHLERGESPAQACVRETREESAYAFTPTALVGAYLWRTPAGGGEGTTYLRFAFCGELGAHDPLQALDTGIVRALWLTPEELRASSARHRSPLVLQCIEDYLRGRRFPLDFLQTDPSVYSDAD